MTSARVLVLVLGVAALSMMVAACGDDDDSGADDQQITDAITQAATSDDPAVCTEVQTAKFTQQTSGEPGESAEQAVESCERDAGDNVAEEVDVSEIEVDGDSATALAAVTGSLFDGQTLDIALVKEGDQWKLDEFRGFEGFDRDSLLAGFEEEISADPEASPQARDCVIQQMDSLSDEQLQAFFVGSDPQSEEQIFRPCEKFFQGE